MKHYGLVCREDGDDLTVWIAPPEAKLPVKGMFLGRWQGVPVSGQVLKISATEKGFEYLLRFDNGDERDLTGTLALGERLRLWSPEEDREYVFQCIVELTANTPKPEPVPEAL